VQGNSNSALGVGAGQRVTGDANVAAGAFAGSNVTGSNNAALGRSAGSGVTGSNNVSIGTLSNNGVSASNVVGIGADSAATANGAIAVGQTARASAANAMALGAGAVAGQAGAVAIGSGSVTAAAVATTGATINGTAYSFAGTAPTSTVSVGAAGSERTITNVAAGRLGATSTDAVNGSQLFATNQAIVAVGAAVNGLGTSVTTLGTSVAGALGGGATMNPATGAVSAPSYAVYGSTQNNVGAAITALQTRAPMQYSTAAAPTTANAPGVAPTNDVTLVGGNAGPVTVHNVAAGVASTDAVNVGQLNSTYQALDKKLSGGIAAMGALVPSMSAMPGQTSIDAGIATYNGQVGLGVGFMTRSENGLWNLNGGAAYSTSAGGRPIVRIGIGRILGGQ
jgi:autotransporter adhesin